MKLFEQNLKAFTILLSIQESVCEPRFNHETEACSEPCQTYNTERFPKKLTDTPLWKHHCAKIVQIRRFFWSVFSCIRTEYGDLRSKSPCFQSEYREIHTRKNSPYLNTFHVVHKLSTLSIEIAVLFVKTVKLQTFVSKILSKIFFTFIIHYILLIVKFLISCLRKPIFLSLPCTYLHSKTTFLFLT